ncbi:helix-turn-helix domain-containing protein [Pseudonocardia sp. TRM90224]|uniref:helix-turn-helix domain-containing protein n=1 Tax=Pseudonocardia sp. TRM90224 TaxID=2812678 RepID=UPI001E410BD0|nr:AraC family transcriptional regulator [Pseudonocardia sp. TRM90224]
MPSSTIHWPGMRSEYASLPPSDGTTTTKANQLGVSFSQHTGPVRTVDGRSTKADVAAGAVFVTGSDAITWSEVGEWTEAMEIYLDPALLPAGGEVVTAMDARDGVVLGAAHVLRRAHLTGGRLTDVEASTLAHRLARHLDDVYAPGARKRVNPPVGAMDRKLVDLVVQFVDAHLQETLTLDRLADVAALSPFHFARAFRASTGISPHRFVTARRMEAARARLVGSRESVVDIAHAVGFSNVSHFRRVFRRELGALPGEVRGTAGMDPPR